MIQRLGVKNNPIFGKIIQDQWLGLDEHNNKVKMSDIAYKSHTKLFWLCEKCNRPYLQDPVHKLYHKTTSCNSCNPYGTSLPEQLLYRCIKQVYTNTINRGKFQGYEFDITIPELKTCIEYGSQYYHEGREQRDREKQLICEKHNVRFISILDSSGYNMDEVWSDNKIVTTIDNDNKLNQVIYVILKTLGIDTIMVDYDKALGDSLDFLRKNNKIQY